MKTWWLAVALVAVTHGFARADEGEVLRWETVVDASQHAVWQSVGTAEGLARWRCGEARLELQLGGSLQMHDRADAAAQDPDWQSYRVLAYEPQSMLAFAVTSTPTGRRGSWEVIRLQPVTPDRTRVTMCYCWENGSPAPDLAALDSQYRGWTSKLAEMHQRKAVAVVPSDQILDRLQTLAGHDWVEQPGQDQGGAVLIMRWQAGPDATSLVGTSWYQTPDGKRPDGAFQVWREPNQVAGNSVRFQNIDAAGRVARGDIRWQDESTLIWDWNSQDPVGAVRRFRLRMHWLDADRYRISVQQLDDSGQQLDRGSRVFRRQAPEDRSPSARHSLEPVRRRSERCG